MQAQFFEGALSLLEHAFSPRTTVQRPERWDETRADVWREVYMQLEPAVAVQASS
jgi:hypothetical protein